MLGDDGRCGMSVARTRFSTSGNIFMLNCCINVIGIGLTSASCDPRSVVSRAISQFFGTSCATGYRSTPTRSRSTIGRLHLNCPARTAPPNPIVSSLTDPSRCHALGSLEAR